MKFKVGDKVIDPNKGRVVTVSDVIKQGFFTVEGDNWWNGNKKNIRPMWDFSKFITLEIYNSPLYKALHESSGDS